MKTSIFLIILINISGFLSAQDWSTTSSNPKGPRFNHNTLKVNDGRVLFIGGSYDNAPVDSVDIYNPITDDWNRGNPIPVSVIDHASVCINDSIVLVFGGRTSAETLSNVWQYDYVNDEWTTKSDMPVDIREHSATVMNDGRILIFGGYSQPSDVDNPWSFVYDPVTDTYSDTVDVITNHSAASAFLLDDGRVLVAGGYEGYSPTNKSEVYDPVAKTWTSVGNVPTTRSGGQAGVKTNNGDVIMAGGYNYMGAIYVDAIEIFDVESETWSILANLDNPVTIPAIGLLDNGEVLIAGGSDDAPLATRNKTSRKDRKLVFEANRSINAAHSSAVSVNPTTGNITSLEDMPDIRGGSLGIKLNDGRIAIMYGHNGSNYYDNGFIYGTSTSNENTFVKDFNVYPNPVSDFIQIESGKINRVQVFSLDGVKLMEKKYSNIDKVNLDISDFNQGLYILKVYSGEDSKEIKIYKN